MKRIMSVGLIVALLLCALAGCQQKELTLEERVEQDCRAMVQAMVVQNFDDAKALLHPIAIKEQQAVDQSLQVLLSAMKNKKVKAVEFDVPEFTERAENDWLVTGTGTITLADENRMSVHYSYLSNGEDGFMRFIVKEITE